MSQAKRIKRGRPPVSARVAGTRRLMDGVFHLDRLLRRGTSRSLQDLAGEIDAHPRFGSTFCRRLRSWSGCLAARADALAAMARVFVEAIFRGQQARPLARSKGGAVVFVQRFTKTLSVYPHLHVLVLDGGYLEEDVGTLEFRQDQGPSAAERGALEDEVELRFSGWLRRHGYLEEGAEGRPDDPWWLTAARAPSGIVSVEPKKSHGRFEVNASALKGSILARPRLVLRTRKRPSSPPRVPNAVPSQVVNHVRRPCLCGVYSR